MSLPEHIFVPVNYSNIEYLRNWRNLPHIRENMYNTELISEEQQLVWYENLVNDRSRMYFVLEQDGIPIGCLSFVDITSNECSWGCYLGETRVWPGSGLVLELAALDYAFSVLEVDFLHAEVLEFNKSPQKIHAVFGYENVGVKKSVVERDGQSVDALVYLYSKEKWKSNREAVVSSLPGKFSSLGDTISFSTN